MPSLLLKYVVVEKKIDRTERWLDKIKNSEHRKDRTELKDNVSAFLNDVKNIPDHLLADYSKKFGLEKMIGTPLTIKKFEDAAKKMNKPEAIKFAKSFNAEIQKMKSSQLGKVLFEKRNLDTHIDNQEPTKLVVVVGGKFKKKKSQLAGEEFNVNFDELSGNIDDSCENLLQLMRDFVSRQKSQFL